MIKTLISIPFIQKIFGYAKDEFNNFGNDKKIEVINKTIQTELSQESMFVKCWRPFFGYCVAIAWLMYMTIICYCVLSNQENSTQLILAMAETTSLWSMALGVLGVSVIKRSTDKRLINLITNNKKGEN